MKISYEILTEVQFEHEYFKGIFSVFKIRPTTASSKILLNFGMEFREQYGRFYIYFDIFHAGVKRSREELLLKRMNLIFTIELVDPQFFNYTARFETKLSQELFYFSNPKRDNEFLHKKSLVSNDDLYKYTSRFFREPGLVKPFGILALKLSTDLCKVYVIRFEAMATYWRYVLVSDYLKAIPNAIVIDKEKQQVFIGPKSITLPSGAIYNCFVSPEPIKLSCKALNRYQLLESSAERPLNGRVIIRALQNPNHTYLSLLPPEEDAEPNRNYSEIII